MAEPDIGRPPVRSVVTVGALLVAGFFGVFGLWSALAPLSTAAIAPGEVTVESKRKTIQHLEGGIVREILVRDGDAVEAGEVLVRLDRTQPRAMLALVEGRLVAARALAARLIAERDRAAELRFPDDMVAAAQVPEVRTAMESQRRIFAARRDDLVNKIAILKKRDSQVREEIRGLEAQIAAEDRQIDLIAGELKSLRTLMEKGLVVKSRLLALERRAAEIEGGRGRNAAAIARARQTISETALKIQELRTARLNEVVRELREVEAQIFDLNERRHAAVDVMRRTEIRAPIPGTVVGLRIATAGGVIAPGEALLDIVPRDDRLVIDARVKPQDIDVVRAGLPAQVRFTAFSQRNSDPVDGDVLAVSADRLADDLTPEGYYLARIALDRASLSALGEAALYPGMQAEVMIVTGRRSALSYFLKPVTDSFNRAFREE